MGWPNIDLFFESSYSESSGESDSDSERLSPFRLKKDFSEIYFKFMFAK